MAGLGGTAEVEAVGEVQEMLQHAQVHALKYCIKRNR